MPPISTSETMPMISSCDIGLPFTSAFVSAEIRSSPGFARRSAIFCDAYAKISWIVVWTSSGFSGRTMPSAHASNCSRSLAGTFTMDMNTWIGSCCAKSATKSHWPRGLISSTSRIASSRAFASSAATAFGENHGFRSARNFVCSGGSRKMGYIGIGGAEVRGTVNA